ncbi:kinase-like domain-containing protein [Irpex lacteus]|nr:kinase-like domain-containing protein [Irpex lacteus]
MPAATSSQNAPSRKFIGAVVDEWQLYSDRAEDYTIGAPIGYGASSIVYAATFQPSNSSSTPQATPCALKVIDLDRLPPHALHLLMQETQLMSLSKHPNVLRVRGTWMDGHKLYIALRLMNSGSAMDVMRFAWPGGMEEEVIRCILKQALEGLNYLHINGLIHRDVKAANLLIDDDGTVLLGDLGVAAPLWDPATEENPASSKRAAIGSSSFNRPGGGHVFMSSAPHHTHAHGHGHSHAKHPHRTLGKRKSFVGTPCWMAPEVITGKQYDASADIWSFGITALELAHGRAPYSRSPPSVALTHIATSPPPKLDRTGCVHTYSAAFAEIVELCLNKDPAKRPSAEELLAMPWFKGAKKKGFLVGAVLKGLPPLATRQERQRLPSVMTHATMESWDFAMTQVGGPGSPRSSSRVASPTTSVYSARSGWRRRGSKVPEDALFDHENEDVGADGVEASQLVEGLEGVALEHGTTSAAEGEDAAAYARRMRARHHARAGSGPRSRAHSRSVSLAESIHEDEDEEAPPQVNPSASPKEDIELAASGSSSSPTTSPSPSSRSSVVEPITPPNSTHHGNMHTAPSGSSANGSGSGGAGRLWRKIVGNSNSPGGIGEKNTLSTDGGNGVAVLGPEVMPHMRRTSTSNTISSPSRVSAPAAEEPKTKKKLSTQLGGFASKVVMRSSGTFTR